MGADGADPAVRQFARGGKAGRTSGEGKAEPAALPVAAIAPHEPGSLGALTRSIPVVMLTSSNIDSDVARAFQLGANSYVQKPVDFERFRRTVRDLALYWMTMNEAGPVSPAAPGNSK